MRNPELWARLQAYAFDGAGSAPFSVKLARGQGWSAGYTARVIEEYRRYVYLTQVSPTQLTPSNAVDAVWHMHLTYTRSYWQDFCPRVLGAELHHTPCAGEEEMPRYRQQFGATKALYEAEFGAAPPADIWGTDAVPKPRPVRRFILSEAAAMNPGFLFVLALLAVVGAVYAGVSSDGLGLAGFLTIGAMFLVFRGLNRVRNIRSDIEARRARGEDIPTYGFAIWFTYESTTHGFEIDAGEGGGDGGGGDGGGCGGCG